VGFAGFPWTVDDAAENADFHGCLAAAEALLQLGDDRLEVDGQPAAGRAGDQLGLPDAALRGLEDVERGSDFGHRIAEQAYANRVADAVEKNRGEAARRFRDGIRRLARLGDADMRGIIGLLGIEPVRLHDSHDVARLERHDEVVIALRLGDLDVADSAIDHGRRAGKAILLGHLAFQAPRVDADAHGDALGLRLANDLAIAVVAANVAGIDADLVDGMVERGQRHLVIEVDIANERELDPPLDLAEDGRILRLGHRDANDLAAGHFQAVNLGQHGLDVVRV